MLTEGMAGLLGQSRCADVSTQKKRCGQRKGALLHVRSRAVLHVTKQAMEHSGDYPLDGAYF